jgi:uncharacterized membrane protein YeaQ/YmgE (transglycosylase-associated protein family)
MSMMVWILLGLALGLLASKIVSTTGEGTVVDILLRIVGAAIGDWLFKLFGDGGLTGLNISRTFTASARRQLARPWCITFSSVAACCEALGEPVSVLECMPRNWPDSSTRW